MSLLRKRRADLGAGAWLLLLPLLGLGPALLAPWTGQSLVPYDVLALRAPWREVMPDLVPHNAALGDVVFQNQAWRHLLRAYLAQGQWPLWNPHALTGTPFLAGGQAGLLYPPALLLLWGNPHVAAALYAYLHLALAGLGMFVFGRALRLAPGPACWAGTAYMLGGFNYTHAVWPTLIATSAWLPWLLAMIEVILRKQQTKGPVSFRPIPYLLLGAAAITMSALAWNPEFFAYGSLFAGGYAAVRLAALFRSLRREERADGAAAPAGARPWYRAQALQRTAKQAVWLGVMLVLGLAMAAIQIAPFIENYLFSYQEAGASFQEVSDRAWPKRQALTFWVPNAYGNPSHHRWFDFWAWRWRAAPLNVFGRNAQSMDWGLRAYPVGSSYVGLATWAFMLLALVASLTPGGLAPRQRRAFWLLAALGGAALLLALGTPLYRVLYALPGWSVILTAHNWSYVWSFCLAALGGIGLQAWRNARQPDPAAPPSARVRQAVQVLGLGACACGVLILGLWVWVWWQPAFFHPAVRWILRASEYGQALFREERMFLGYQMGNALHLGAVSGAVGAWLLRFRRAQPHADAARGTWRPVGWILAVLAADLFLAHGRFLPRSDPAWEPGRTPPPAARFLAAREPAAHTWRLTTLTRRGQGLLDANLGFYFGWHDLRGKTFLLPAQFVRVFARLGQAGWRGRNVDLNFNRAGYLYATYASPPHLDSPLLDLWNVKYLLTYFPVTAPGWEQVFQDGALRIFENRDALPRAFLVTHAVTAPADALPFRDVDWAATVLLEGAARREQGRIDPRPDRTATRIARYEANEVRVATRTSAPAWLVLADAYFPGWKAYLHAGPHADAGIEAPVLRANGSLRAVPLPAGFDGEVRFVYSPLSVRVGLFFSFLSVILSFMLLLWWGWGRYRRPGPSASEAVVVAKNIVVPMNLTLITRGVEFAFAMLYVRLLGPVGTGQFAFVIALYGIFELISRFGLDTLLTREVAKDKRAAHRYLTNVCVLRTGIWFLTALAMFSVTWLFWQADRITAVEVQTIAIFALVMLFAGYSDALSAAFHAYEKMEYPASLTTFSALLKAGLGAWALLSGWGLPGLAWVAALTVIVQVVWFYAALRRSLFRWRWEWDAALQRWMLANSLPFLLNSLLANILLNIDIWLLRLLSGEVASGLYSVALKYRFGITLIPSVFNFAIFPLFSRYAQRTGDGLLGAYRLSVRLLTLVSVPLAFAFTWWARPLVLFVGGADFVGVAQEVTLFQRAFTYVGGSDLALRLVIWTILLNFVNAVTQYVLIALNQQRYLTQAFAGVVLFNVAGNALLIPVLGYAGAALVTNLSELFLFVSFQVGIRRHLGPVGWRTLIWKPLLGLAVMILVAWGLGRWGLNLWVSGLAAGVGYAGTLWLTGEVRQLAAYLPLSDLRSLFHRPSAPSHPERAA